MALIASLSVNDRHIGVLVATRSPEDPHHPEPDDVCHYKVEGHLNGQMLPEVEVEHRFGDGALALVAKMAASLDQGREQPPGPIAMPEDLDALPVGSVVLDRHGDSWQKVDDTELRDGDGERLRSAWASVGWRLDRTAQQMIEGLPPSTNPYNRLGPFRLLYDPREA